MDWSIVIAAAALAVSVLSPILTAIINHRYALKNKRIEFDEQHRIAALERYIRAAGAVTGRYSDPNAAEYWASCGEVYMYIPSALWPYVDQISAHISETQIALAQLSIAEFSKQLPAYGLIPKLHTK